MYNGIGLETARGSGTNGYVQRNLSALRKHAERVDYKNDDELKKMEAQFNKKPNKDILEHDRKRQVEVKCMEMQELMEDQGFSEEEIIAKVTQFRKLLLEKAAVSENAVIKDDFGRPIATETHQIALATEEKNARWREAFGIQARDDEKKDFGEKMEERWEDEQEVEDRRREKEEERERRKEKKKRKELEEGLRIREEEKLERNEERERKEKKKHKKRKSRSRSASPAKKKKNRSRSPQSPSRRRHDSPSPRKHRHDSPATSKRRHHHESPKRRHRRHSESVSPEPERHHSRKKH